MVKRISVTLLFCHTTYLLRNMNYGTPPGVIFSVSRYFLRRLYQCLLQFSKSFSLFLP